MAGRPEGLHHTGVENALGMIRHGVVTAFILDPAPKNAASFPEGITVGGSGVIWGASIHVVPPSSWRELSIACHTNPRPFHFL